MSTRAQIRFATREDGVSFSEHPDKIHAQFYCHSDGYPEGLGMEIAESMLDNLKLRGWQIEHVQDRHGDLEYIYYIWSDYDKDTFISIFEINVHASVCETCGQHRYLEDKCIFVGTPSKLIETYSQTKND